MLLHAFLYAQVHLTLAVNYLVVPQKVNFEFRAKNCQ